MALVVAPGTDGGHEIIVEQLRGFNGQMQGGYGAEEDGFGGCFGRRVPQLVGRGVPDLGGKGTLHQTIESFAEEMPT